MNSADMVSIGNAFVLATQHADICGFDLLEIDMGHGRLLGSFLSPLSNRRDDEYGGTLEDRLRYPLHVFDAVRSVWPGKRPLAVSLNAGDWRAGGLIVEEATEIARVLREHGCDLIHIATGRSTIDDVPAAYGRGWQTQFADAVRNDAGIRTMAGGYLAGADEMNTILAAGRADLCVVAPRLYSDLPWLRGQSIEPAITALKARLRLA